MGIQSAKGAMLRRACSTLAAFLFLLMPFDVGSTESSLEWPVYFEHLGHVHCVHNKFDWFITLRLHLPTLEARIDKTLQRLKLLSDMEVSLEEEEEVNEEVQSTPRASSDSSRLEDLEIVWYRLNKHLTFRASSLKRRAEGMRDVGAVRKRRKKRQNGVGGILQSLFGVAYHGDVENVNSRINDVEQRLNGDINNVRSSQNILESATNTKLFNQERVIEDVEKMTTRLERKVADMETNPLLKSNLADIVHTRNEQYQSLELELDLMEERLGEIERLVIALSSGKICPSVISPHNLRVALYNIEQQLPLNMTLLFPSADPLWPYYSEVGCAANFDIDMESAIIRVSIPLVDLNSIMDLQRVHNLPLKVRDGYSVTADIATEYLVTDRGKDYFLELNKEDFQDCQMYKRENFGILGQHHFYCGLKPMLKAHAARSCVMQLYQGQSDPTWCQSRLRHDLVQPFARLYNGSWIYSALHDEIAVVKQCPDGQPPQPLHGFGVIDLSDGCSVTSAEFWYPKTFTGAVDITLNFGDDGWDSDDFLNEVPLKESLFESQQSNEVLDDDERINLLQPDTIGTLGFIPQRPEEDNLKAESSVSSTESVTTTTTFSDNSAESKSEQLFDFNLYQKPEVKSEQDVNYDILHKLAERLKSVVVNL